MNEYDLLMTTWLLYARSSEPSCLQF